MKHKTAILGEIEAIESFCTALRHQVDRNNPAKAGDHTRSIVARCHNLMEMGVEAVADKHDEGRLTELLGYLTRRLAVDECREDIRVPGLRHALNKVQDMLNDSEEEGG